jgi:hypothetical protein
MRSYGEAVRVLILVAVLVLPEHLDVLSGANGGIGVGGVLGGGFAALTERDIAKGGLIGGSAGLVIGVALAGVQAAVLGSG